MIIEYQNKVKDIEKYYENSEKMPKVYQGEWAIESDEHMSK